MECRNFGSSRLQSYSSQTSFWDTLISVCDPVQHKNLNPLNMNGIAFPVDLAPEVDPAGNGNPISSASPASATPPIAHELFAQAPPGPPLSPYNLANVLAEFGMPDLLPKEKDLLFPPDGKAMRA